MQGAAYRHADRPRHARRPSLRSPRTWLAGPLVSAQRLPRYWTRRGLAAAAGLLFATAALITSILVAITMQATPSDVHHEAVVPPVVPVIPLPQSSASTPARQRHVRPRQTTSPVPLPAAAVPAPAPRPPTARSGKPEAFPAALMLGGTRVGRLTITAAGGPVQWTATAFGVSLSVWSGTLSGGQSMTVIVSALNAGGTGWVNIEPGDVYVQVTWTASLPPRFPY
ncbi:MAG: hypothetical protein JO345_32525 [Streptosporangiaceae bacterium]|nr:hypothetical protein [Streptosporangiaceae bacterium]